MGEVGAETARLERDRSAVRTVVESILSRIKRYRSLLEIVLRWERRNRVNERR